ncbi:non-ribosomal peptide synthetase [Nocardia sp. CA-107356]|uniref:non-ribosomal peptide synthetase n=1 Tax=Nocardia sp. CA-107356 TaxID=3239972 RepID=UPI003D8EB81D
MTLHSAFLRSAHDFPDAPAIWFETGALTYAELEQRSGELADRLAAEGAGPGVPVGLCVERTPDMIIGLLAILRAGACFLPLDPEYPADRLRFMVRDSGAHLLLTTPAVRERCPQGPTLLIVGDTIETEPGQRPGASVVHDAAYVVYTSGSTGQPKGVVIRHHSCAAMLSDLDRIFARCDLSGVAAVTSICFDLSVMEIFSALARGRSVILVDSALHLAASPHLHRVTHLNTVPSIMSSLLDGGALPPNLRTVVLGGETVRHRLVDRVYRETTADRVFNGYGPTEGTVFCSFKLVPPDAAGDPSIGTPSITARIYVLDRSLRSVPAGQPGELYLGGAGLALGYINRPRTTAERFVPDPHLVGERMYRTGDIVRRTADGELEFAGRADHQVKVRGFRIELEEVQTRLSECPEVREAAAVVRPVAGNSDSGALIAYAVPELESAQATSDNQPWLDPQLQSAIRARLSAALPEHMIPGAIVFLSELPTAPNGKLDRATLPDPPVPETTESFESPGTPTEVALREIWGTLLDREPDTISVRAAFYDLGGNSLLLVRLARTLNRQFGRRVSAADLFRFRTIATLGRWLDDDSDAAPEAVQQARRRAGARRAALRERGRSPGA